MSRDDPFHSADNESTDGYRKNGNAVCDVDIPTSIEARAVGSKMDYLSSGQSVLIDPENGFVCENNQNDPGCKDYEVRFCCPGEYFSIRVEIEISSCGDDLSVSLFLEPCYRDNSSRVLKGDSSCIGQRRCYHASSDMTIEMCKDFCRTRGWAIAGTESFTECFCGNVAPTERIPASICDRPCGGNSEQICGGDWAMTLHFL